MSDSLDLFTGILLTAIGLVLIYGSIIYRLIDLVLLIGVLITILGLYKLLPAFLSRLVDSRNSRSRSNPKLSGSKEVSKASILKEGVDELNRFLDGEDKKEKSKSILKPRSESSLDSPNQMTFDEYMNKSKTDFATSYSPKEVKPIFKDNTVDESKQVLRTKPVKEEKSKFKLPSIKRNSSKKPKTRSYAFLKDKNDKQSPDKVYFTPNYEKPMRVSKPKKKSENKLKLSESPKRSKEISRALASVGPTETIYDNDVSDDSYSLMPKEIDEELIMPIDEIDLDATDEVPVYNLSQSENTLYNNLIYDEGSDSDFSITPIHAESDEEDSQRDYVDVYDYDDEDSQGDYVDVYDYDDEEDIYSEVYTYGDKDSSTYLEDDDSPIYIEDYEDSSADFDDDYITVEASDDEIEDSEMEESVESLPRPTSIASTNPIPKKETVSNLSRPTKKVDSLPKPKSTSNLAKPHKKAEAIDLAALEKPKPIDVSALKKPKPKGDAVAKEEFSKEELDEIIQDPSEKTIQIDPNNPESLPIPKLLNSYVICEKGILTSQEAFEEVASHSRNEILLEAPTIKDMGERFLSRVSEIKTRMIIQEFDLADISYVLLLSSLIKKGVEIKTLPLVNSFNLIGDDSHALLISNSIDQNDFEYGAVYTDKPSIDNIKELFESSWAIANSLDVSNVNEDETEN
ncbi:MAG: hypothetical protein IKV87_08725 [Methanobrevibacter sp.]|nr:hypothetical protein [Methanobrevibacter sp.]